MIKSKVIFQCKSCGHQSSKWTGKCNECNEWNSIIELTGVSSGKKQNRFKKTQSTPSLINHINENNSERIQLKDIEFNRVLGGGIVKGSVILIGGEPGIGKSTLTLKIALSLNASVLYIAGEESNEQIKMRAKRLGLNNEECYVYNETNVNAIINSSDKINPCLIIIDSIQTLHVDNVDASAGSVSQIRHSAEQLINYSKETNIPIIIIGHITKDGAIAGPKFRAHGRHSASI